MCISTLAILAASGAFFISGAHAADCPLSSAVYYQEYSGYEVHFSPNGEESDNISTLNFFEMRVPNFERKIFGAEIVPQGTPIPHGYLVVDKSAEDVLSGDVGDQWLWSGKIYALFDRDAEILDGGDAPDAILFSDLHVSLRYSEFWELGIDLPGSDVFKFKTCRE